jgi:hypothetical protein
MTNPPNQQEIDQIAALVEAVRELKNEPFFHPDEKISFHTQGDKIFSFSLGDRFHFRSALVTFRRIWMNDEPSNFNRCCNVIWLHQLEGHKQLLESCRAEVKRITNSPAFAFLPFVQNTDITVGTLINLWLNAVFAHVAVEKIGDTRHQFEACLKRYGQAPMEFAFRLAVRNLGLQYINMSNLAAEQFLKQCEADANLRPSFEIGSPFGIKLKEVTPDGHTMIRKSSSKFFNEEPFEKMVERILSREHYSNLRFLADHLGFSSSEKAKAVAFLNTVENIVSKAGKQISLEDFTLDKTTVERFSVERIGPSAFSTLFDFNTGRKSGIRIDDSAVYTSQLGIDLLNENFKRFRAEIQNEAKD